MPRVRAAYEIGAIGSLCWRAISVPVYAFSLATLLLANAVALFSKKRLDTTAAKPIISSGQNLIAAIQAKHRSTDFLVVGQPASTLFVMIPGAP